jgi:hypothetical protein
MKRDYVYEFIKLPFRALLCKFGIHDYECAEVEPFGALLYCFYCEHSKWSHALPKTKAEADEAYEEWLRLGKPK